MPSDEEKDLPEREPVEQAASFPLSRRRTEESEPADHEPVKQEPAERETAEQGPAEQEPEEQEPAEEGKKKNYWWLTLGLILLLLGGGGFFALTGLRQAAHKLGGGSDYEQLSANSSIYDGAGAPIRNADYFPLDEEAARQAGVQAAGAVGARTDRTNPALIRTKEELVADASGNGVSRSAVVEGGEEDSSAAGKGAAPAAHQGVMAEKLQAKVFLSPGPGSGSKSMKNSAPGGAAVAFQGSGAVIGKASDQSETLKAGAPKKGGPGSVMEALKGVFMASLHGARSNSKDKMKNLGSVTFDGATESTTAIEYDEKARSLDKVGTGSAPKASDLSAEEAKRLTASEVGKPDIDKDGTKSALAADAAYQRKKLSKDYAGSMINGMFAGVSGTGTPKNEDEDEDTDRNSPPDDPDGMNNFSDPEIDPEIEEYLLEEELQDYIDTYGFGGECGCTQEAPCCCMPGAAVDDGGGMIGDFPPDDGLSAFA